MGGLIEVPAELYEGRSFLVGLERDKKRDLGSIDARIETGRRLAENPQMRAYGDSLKNFRRKREEIVQFYEGLEECLEDLDRRLNTSKKKEVFSYAVEITPQEKLPHLLAEVYRWNFRKRYK